MIFFCNWNEEGYDEDFFWWMVCYFECDEVVVFGGNDNSDGYFFSGFGVMRIDLGWDFKDLVCWYEGGDVWIFFSCMNGKKVMVDFFVLFGEVVEWFCSRVFEFIDIKVIDFCLFNCVYCY